MHNMTLYGNPDFHTVPGYYIVQDLDHSPPRLVNPPPGCCYSPLGCGGRRDRSRGWQPSCCPASRRSGNTTGSNKNVVFSYFPEKVPVFNMSFSTQTFNYIYYLPHLEFQLINNYSPAVSNCLLLYLTAFSFFI